MYDLSIVTDALFDILNDAVTNSPLWPGGTGPTFSHAITGQHPEQVDAGHECVLNLYLYHVSADKYLRNQFWAPQNQSGGAAGSQPVAFEPLCLDLWYLLSAQSRSSYNYEQQMLGVAMHAFHRHGTVMLNTPVPPPGTALTTEVSLVLESPSFDELSRLWQALGVSLRTTAQYRVSVAFLTMDAPAASAPEVDRVHVLTGPVAPAPDPELPELIGTSRTVHYTAPAGKRHFDQSPASTAPAPGGVDGQQVTVRGTGLLDTDGVVLVSVDAAGAETTLDVTDWKAAPGLPLVLRPPDTAGVCPTPGRYRLRITRAGAQSNGVPIDIAPWVDPAGGPLLAAGAGGIYTCEVRNAPPAGLIVQLGTVRLTPGSNPAPGVGEWTLNGTTLSFRAPDALAPGQYRLTVQSGEIGCDPALWAVQP
jgi:hypothetical protein